MKDDQPLDSIDPVQEGQWNHQPVNPEKLQEVLTAFAERLTEADFGIKDIPVPVKPTRRERRRLARTTKRVRIPR